jgi:S-adenosylmethionine hydrolase
MNRQFFGLLTDFGHDFAVASMEALLYRDVSNAMCIHLDHTVKKFSIISGAFIIEKTYRYFPAHTIFIGVIDPGVGSNRAPLCIEYDGFVFIGPDNGLFSPIIRNKSAVSWRISHEVLTPATHTFHGRDLFVPAAILYAQGKREFLIPHANPILLSSMTDQHSAAYIDSFGNIKTSIPCPKPLEKNKAVSVEVRAKKHSASTVHTFSDVPLHHLVVYRGSNDTLEIAVTQGSARDMLGCSVEDTVRIEPLD